MKVFLVLRGGSYFDEPWDMSSTDRDWFTPEVRFRFDGFRLVVRRQS